MSILKESEMTAGAPFCLSHIGIPTVDADATIEFYERLGFTVIGRFANPRTNSLAVFLRLGNAVLEIYEGKEADTVYLTKTRTPAPLKYNLTARCFGIAAIAACAILLTASKHKAIRVAGDIISALGWLFMGVLSLILVFVMTATNHDVTYYNFNAFIISPAVLALAVLHAASIGKTERRNAIGRLSVVLFAVAAVLLVMKGCIMMTGYTQDNIGYYAIALAAYAAEIAVMKLSSSRRSR